MTRLSPLTALLRAAACTTLWAILPMASLIAQTAATTARPHFVIETVGPDGWRTRLGPTNVATMLSSEAGRTIWQPSLEPLLGMWQMMIGDEQAFAASSKRIFEYGGVIRIAARINQSATAHLALMFEPDGRTDLAVLANDLKEMLGKGIPGEWQNVPNGAKQIRLRTMGDNAMTEPMLESGRMYLVAGELATIAEGMQLAAHLMTRPSNITAAKPGSPVLHFTMDVPEILAMTDADDEEAKVAKALGFAQLQEVTYALKAAGPRVELDITATMRGAARGMVAAFAPKSTGVSQLLQLLPGKASAWKVGRFDCGALYDGIVDAIVASEYAKDTDAVHKDINEECGTDVRKQLLGNMTDELLVVGSPFQNFDSADEATWMIAFRLKQEEPFRKALQVMMPNAKPMLSTAETVDVDGVELRRYGNMFNYDIWMAAGNGIFVIAAGRDAEEEATALLRKAKTMTPAATAAISAGFQDLTRYLPPGLHGLAQSDIGSMLAIPSDWWLEMFNEMAPLIQGPQLDPEEAEAQQEQFHELLKTHNLLLLRSATGRADGSWHWRLFW